MKLLVAAAVVAVVSMSFIPEAVWSTQPSLSSPGREDALPCLTCAQEHAQVCARALLRARRQLGSYC